jgi:hypothetical protein
MPHTQATSPQPEEQSIEIWWTHSSRPLAEGPKLFAAQRCPTATGAVAGTRYSGPPQLLRKPLYVSPTGRAGDCSCM